MIEIKCTQEQKEILLNYWRTDNDAICDAMSADDCRKAKTGCAECAEINIKWIIEEGE